MFRVFRKVRLVMLKIRMLKKFSLVLRQNLSGKSFPELICAFPHVQDAVG